MMKEFLKKIDAFLAKHGKTDTWFSEKVMNDKSFVRQIRLKRRSPSVKTLEKVERAMAKLDKELMDEKA